MWDSELRENKWKSLNYRIFGGNIEWSLNSVRTMNVGIKAGRKINAMLRVQCGQGVRQKYVMFIFLLNIFNTCIF